MNFDMKISENNIWQIFAIFCLSALLFTLLPNIAEAADSSDAITNVICAIVNRLTGPLGRGISTIAIVVLGVGLFLGKLSWPVAVATGIGIGLIFGAGTMVSWLGAAGASGSGTMVTSCNS